MRYGVWAAAGLCAAWAAGPARAQTGSAATILGGASPSSIVFQPIDMKSVIAPSPALQAGQGRFNFSALFNKFSMPSPTPIRGTSALPAPSSFPSTRYPSFKMLGTPPRLLGNPNLSKSPFQPVMPIIPSTTTPVGPGS
jgi:hypothetical protein